MSERATRKRSEHPHSFTHAHIIRQVRSVIIVQTVGLVVVQYGAGGVHGLYWQQLAPMAQPLVVGMLQPE
jgi:hypothetical protein